MLTRERIHRILGLGLPIVAGMLSQNILNLVDAAFVGVLGDDALAAVGLGNFANFMATAFITGLAAGVQSVAARRKGEARASETAVPLNGGVLLAAGLGLPLTAILIVLAPALFPLLTDDAGVSALGVPYLQARLIGLVPMGINFAFRGYWNAVDMSGKYLRTLVVMHVSNAVLAWAFVFGKLGAPEMGALGAGVATTIATFIGTGYYVALAWRHAREGGFLRSFPDKGTIRSMLKVSLPSGLQQFLFAAGMTALYWVVGKVGTAELAAANVLTTLTLVALLPGLGFGLAASTLVGQALGRKDPGDARAWGWDVSRFAALAIAVVCLAAIVAPDLILRGFLHDADTREIARTPLRIVAILAPLDAIGVVLMNAIVGAGDARRVMVVSVGLQWVVFLPGAYVIGPVLGHGLLGIWILQAAYRILQAALIARLWSKGEWAAVKL